MLEEFTHLLDYIKSQADQVYLVGGAVRDQLLSRPVHDLDFVVAENAPWLARQTANHLQGAYYLMDAQRNIARVILNTGPDKNLVLDFSNQQGETLEDDLRKRDFTINAIAVDLTAGKMIDPLEGARHLREKTLIACSPQSFLHDPIRVMRALRFTTELSMRMAPETKALFYQAVPLLPRVSGERQRDELFRLAAGEKPAGTMRLLHHTGILKTIIPEAVDLYAAQFPDPVGGFEWGFKTLQPLGHILDFIEGKREQVPETLYTSLVFLHLGRHRARLAEHLQTRLNASRSLRGLVCLAGTFFPVFADPPGNAAARKRDLIALTDRLKHLAFSRTEISYFESILSQARLFTELVSAQQTQTVSVQEVAPHQKLILSRRDIHRYFKTAGTAGIEICLLSLAFYGAKAGQEPDMNVYTGLVEAAAVLLDAFFNHQDEVVSPLPLVNGTELINRLSVPSGKQLGVILSRMVEEQAAGSITNSQQALDFARSLLKKPDKHNQG
jgi:tRNA nucleotidyltransferase/poly(A) polymerase